jgi:CRP-like cAMP-binding protein
LANLLTFTKSHPIRSLVAGETLIEMGEAGGELYVLQSGRLVVERDGVEIARITEPGSLIGEMSVLLGVDHSANVRAETAAVVRVIERAIAFLETTPIVALHVATMVCQRLDATSALLVQLKKEMAGKQDQGFLERLFGAVSGTETHR